jgi:hypothetical protein
MHKKFGVNKYSSHLKEHEDQINVIFEDSSGVSGDILVGAGGITA